MNANVRTMRDNIFSDFKNYQIDRNQVTDIIPSINLLIKVILLMFL